MEPELDGEIDRHLRGLRAADTQATAIAWMKKAYTLLEECQKRLRDRPEQIVRERLVMVPERPKLEIVQSVPTLAHLRKPQPVWFDGRTVVYPPVPMPPQKPQPAAMPRAWTRKDTLRLERSIIQKRGR